VLDGLGLSERSKTRTPSLETEEAPRVSRNKDAQRIGAWGEEWVLEKCLPSILQQEFKDSVINRSPEGFELLSNGTVVARVTWLNYICERHQPYDILVEKQSLPNLYVEVKSTSHAETDWFDITRNEWGLAANERENYCIYRVYGCGSKSPERMVIDDPYGRWERGELEANPVRLRL
jgi:hypothetical protein